MDHQANIQNITPAALHQMREQGDHVDIIDVSTPVEFREVRLEGAQNLPIDSSELKTFMRDRRADKPLYVMCRGGVRSVKACNAYPQLNLINIEGGTRNWTDTGLPVLRDRNVMSLERQTRIAAGGLFLTATALAVLVNPYFLGIGVFVGLGLVVAGVTNTCGMALLLAKMPWNRATRSAKPAVRQSYSHS